MLALTQHNASLSNLNIRIERHGDERQLAADMKLTMNVAGAVLDTLESGLHASLFRQPGTGEQPDLIDPALLTAVKFPHLEPVKLSHKFPGYEAEIGASDIDWDPLFLADAELKKITARPLEGGSVELSLSLSANIDSEDASVLTELLVREDVCVSLVPPKAQAQQAANDDAGESDIEADAA